MESLPGGSTDFYQRSSMQPASVPTLGRTLGLPRRAAAEALAAFAPVFAGCGAIIADAYSGGGLGTTDIGLVFGLAIMAMVYATGGLSGAHINPAGRSPSPSPATSPRARPPPTSPRNSPAPPPPSLSAAPSPSTPSSAARSPAPP
jgi:hypothetical protein